MHRRAFCAIRSVLFLVCCPIFVVPFLAFFPCHFLFGPAALLTALRSFWCVFQCRHCGPRESKLLRLSFGPVFMEKIEQVHSCNNITVETVVILSQPQPQAPPPPPSNTHISCLVHSELHDPDAETCHRCYACRACKPQPRRALKCPPPTRPPYPTTSHSGSFRRACMAAAAALRRSTPRCRRRL